MNKKTKKKIVITSAIALVSLSVLTAKKYKTIDNIKNDDDNHVQVINAKQISKLGLIDRIPLFLKYLFLVPLWVIGNIIIRLVDKLLKLITMPIIKVLIKLLITFLILFGIILFILKLIYPEKKLRELISKKLVLVTFILSVILVIADYILIKYLDNYVLYKDIIIFVIGLIGLIRIIYPFYKRKHNEPKIIYEEI